MAKERIQVYTEGTKLKQRIDALRGNYHITTWCFMVLEKEVERLERKQLKDNRK